MSITKKGIKSSTTASKERPIPITEIKRKQRMLGFVRTKVSARSRIRAIGNSKGVILSNQLIKAAGLNAEADIVIQASDGVIYILQVKAPDINTDLSTWDKQFKAAIKRGAKPENDLFEGMTNNFDLKEW
jgi:antitoxin component of MazEF toxin-antitoxin module